MSANKQVKVSFEIRGEYDLGQDGVTLSDATANMEEAIDKLREIGSADAKITINGVEVEL